MDNKYYTSYKGLFYKFIPAESTNWNTLDMWWIADREDHMGWFFTFNADYYRIDQCFDHVEKEMNSENSVNG